MKVIQISVSYSRSLNLGNFNNVKAEMSMTIDVEVDDDFHQIQSEAYEITKDAVFTQLKEAIETEKIRKARGK